MYLDDMRLFSEVAQTKSFTAAAGRLGIPKQTLSRRIAQLETRLQVQLLQRTTRKVRLTEVGAAYASRCAEIVRLAEDADLAVTDTQQEPQGNLRITADPVFGEAFLTGLILEYAKRYPDVRTEVVLTRRKLDLIEEGIDVAFRIGLVDDPALTAICLGPARIRYCASPGYIRRRGAPKSPQMLDSHDCIVVASEGAQVHWPFSQDRIRGGKTPKLIAVYGRMRMNSLSMARAAVLSGLGISIFPEFACAKDIARQRLVSVLDPYTVDVGGVWLAYPTNRYLAPRIKTFVALARERLAHLSKSKVG